MPTSTRNRDLPGEIAHGIVLVAVIWLIKRLFGQDINALIEAVADRADREVHIRADMPPITLAHAAVAAVPSGEVGVADELDPFDEDPDQPAPPWYRAPTHNNDGTPQFQPIDPTDTDWPDPMPTESTERTAMVEPGTDVLAMIRATPNPANVPLPSLSGELSD